MSVPRERSQAEHDGPREGNEPGPPATFDIYVYDDNSGTAKMDKFVTIGSFKHVVGTKLSEIRAMLNNENGLNFRLQGSPFCNKVGAVANESLPFAEYIKSLDRGLTKSDDKNKQTSTDEGYSLRVPMADEPVTEPQAYAVYFKSRALFTGLNDETKEILNEKLDLGSRKAEIGAIGKPDILTSSYDRKSFLAAVGKGTVVHPADMTQAQWNIVMETNALLHGSYVRQPRSGIAKRKVERAMYPAFRLKPRQFEDFNASLNDENIVPPSRNLIIPRYRVEDDSYVEVSENQSSVAWAIASSSLSETAAEVAVGTGIFGISAGARLGFKNEDAEAASATLDEKKRLMTITYNFPRVVLELDEESLEVSNECAKSLQNIKDLPSVQAFKAKYGAFFATRIELGGRLHATEDSDALGTATVSDKSQAMKKAASLSFASPWVQASASGSSSSSTGNHEENSGSSLSVSMTWEAKGGDTLLCNNPPAWCSTVASFYNWRVVKQENLLSIEDMISRIPGHENVQELFQTAMKNTGEKKEEGDLVRKTITVRFRMPWSPGACLAISNEPRDSISEDLKRLGGGTSAPAVAALLKEYCKPWRQVCSGENYSFDLTGIIDVDKTTNTNRVLVGSPYTICSSTDKYYLKGTPKISQIPFSFLHGAEESAWTFAMKPVGGLQSSGPLGPQDQFNIAVFDGQKQPMGLLKASIRGGLLSAGGSGIALPFVLEYL